jgi:uncharacterized protein (DUF1330 family)
MAKGYWIANVDIHDAEGYKSYVAANAEPLRKFGGRFLVRSGRSNVAEGKLRSRVVVVEFADYATAQACYNSPEYVAAIKLRKDVSTADLVIIEGYDGPQPADG